MGTRTATVERVEAIETPWRAGLVGGVGGGLGMGMLLHAGSGAMPFIGALYGSPSVIGGWAAHMVHSIVIGFLFALLMSRPLVRGRLRSVTDYTAAGLLYAAGVGLLTSGVLLPVGMRAVGARSIPDPWLPFSGAFGIVLAVLSVGVAHIVYGLTLGATFGLVQTES